MSVKTENGGSPDAPVFDFNVDGVIRTAGDTASVTREHDGESSTEDIAFAGRKMDTDKGMPTAPAIMGNRRYTAGTATDEGVKIQVSELKESAATLTGRLSWKQLIPSQ